MARSMELRSGPGWEVRFGNRAGQELGALGSRPRGMLINALAVHSRHLTAGPQRTLRVITAAGHLAGCELLPTRRVLLVYAVRPTRELERELLTYRLARLAWRQPRTR